MAAEGKLRDKLKARVKAYGGEVRAVKWIGRSNAPDVLCLFPKRSLGQEWGHPFVETKGVEPDAREAQLREHERMRAAGCEVVLCRNEQELDAWLPPL
jgi:hypothetical protein